MAAAEKKGGTARGTAAATRRTSKPQRAAVSKSTSGSKTRKPAPHAAQAAPHDDIDSRQRVINAAIACILEQGLYRASSNAIAERAGLTWGVIQYYFGTRERLMLAVLEEGSKRLSERLRDAQITGGTVEERIAQCFDVLHAYYGAPEYLVFSQVLINLSHDPLTSEHTDRKSVV